jgi:hypothetical protein
VTWHPDKLWGQHPAVTKGFDRNLGHRAADMMKRILATWAALIIVMVFILIWITWNSSVSGHGHHLDLSVDPAQPGPVLLRGVILARD